MKYTIEKNLVDFEAWAGAKHTLNTLTFDQIDTLEYLMEDLFYGQEIEDVTINDFLWFETDYIAELLGFSNWEELEEHNKE